MSRNPATCPHNIVDIADDDGAGAEAYCFECGLAVEHLSECCGAVIKNGFCSDCMEHAE